MATTEEKKFKVMGSYGSAPTRTIVTFLEISKLLPYEFVPINLEVKQQLTPEYKKMNPNARVPCVQDLDGEYMWESHAILKYLCDQYKAPDHWYPRDPKKRVHVDMLLDWRHTMLYPYLALNFIYPQLLPNHKLDTQEATNMKIAYGKRMMENEFTKLNDCFLADGKKYLTGSEISIADISVACVYDMLRLVNYQDRIAAKCPVAQAWFERISSLPEFKQVAAKGFDGWVAWNMSSGMAYKD